MLGVNSIECSTVFDEVLFVCIVNGDEIPRKATKIEILSEVFGFFSLRVAKRPGHFSCRENPVIVAVLGIEVIPVAVWSYKVN